MMDKKFSNNKLFRRNSIMFYECTLSVLILDKIDNISFELKILWLFFKTYDNKNLCDLSFFINLNNGIRGQLKISTCIKK